MSKQYEKLSWPQSRDLLVETNPDLCRIIDALPQHLQPSFTRMRYAYGQSIMRDGQLCLPDGTVDEQHVYGLGVVIRKQCEAYMADSHRVRGHHLLKPGQLMGVWTLLQPSDSLNPKHLWQISAGGRSVFMLPSITDTVSYQRLSRELNLQQPLPRQAQSQWACFREIANHPDIQSRWQAELLFLPNSWLESLSQDVFANVREYLHNYAWRHSAKVRTEGHWKSQYAMLREANKLHWDSQLVARVSYLLSVITHQGYGFAPLTNDELAPVSTIQEIYTTGAYRLRHYYPTMMGLASLAEGPVYYSPAWCVVNDGVNKTRLRASITKDIADLYEAYDIFKSLLIAELGDVNTQLCQYLALANIDCYHDKPGKHVMIQETAKLIEFDDRFLGGAPEQAFAKHADFLRGCIRISNTATQKSPNQSA